MVRVEKDQGEVFAGGSADWEMLAVGALQIPQTSRIHKEARSPELIVRIAKTYLPILPCSWWC